MSYRHLFALVSTLGSSNTASLQCLCLRNSYKENIAAPSVWSREICFVLDEMLALSTTLESKASGQGFPFPEKCTLTSSMTPKLQNRQFHDQEDVWTDGRHMCQTLRHSRFATRAMCTWCIRMGHGRYGPRRISKMACCISRQNIFNEPSDLSHELVRCTIEHMPMGTQS